MSFRFSGHETFPFRYAWLPKAVRAVHLSASTFADEESAMVELGLGKNMVRSARFWTEAAGLIYSSKDGLAVTDLGRELLLDGGHDPYLEDIQTLWLIHWLISTQSSPLGAWDYLLNKWHEPRLTKSRAVMALAKLAEKETRVLSMVTLEQHFDVFLHTYIATRSRKGEVQEDNLDSPLVELALLQLEVTRVASGRSPEASYSFRVDEKNEIGAQLFIWCLEKYWERTAEAEVSMPFNLIAYGHGSPGQIFKISESGIRQRLELIAYESRGRFTFVESSSVPHVVRNLKEPAIDIASIYGNERSSVYA